jgi:hypothetical protein
LPAYFVFAPQVSPFLKVVLGFATPSALGTANSVEVAVRPGYSLAKVFKVALLPASAALSGLRRITLSLPTMKPPPLYVVSAVKYGNVVPQSWMPRAA